MVTFCAVAVSAIRTAITEKKGEMATLRLLGQGLGNKHRVQSRPSQQLVAAHEYVQAVVAKYVVGPHAPNLSNGWGRKGAWWGGRY